MICLPSWINRYILCGVMFTRNNSCQIRVEDKSLSMSYYHLSPVYWFGVHIARSLSVLMNKTEKSFYYWGFNYVNISGIFSHHMLPSILNLMFFLLYFHNNFTFCNCSPICKNLAIYTESMSPSSLRMFIYTVQCRYIAVGFSHKYSQKTTHGSPVRARFGVSFVDSTSDWYSAWLPAFIYAISYYIGTAF